MLNDTEFKYLFEKTTTMLSGQPLGDSIDVLCTYLSLTYAVHKDKFDSIHDYLDLIRRNIFDNYYKNFNREDIKEIFDCIQIKDK